MRIDLFPYIFSFSLPMIHLNFPDFRFFSVGICKFSTHDAQYTSNVYVSCRLWFYVFKKKNKTIFYGRHGMSHTHIIFRVTRLSILIIITSSALNDLLDSLSMYINEKNKSLLSIFDLIIYFTWNSFHSAKANNLPILIKSRSISVLSILNSTDARIFAGNWICVLFVFTNKCVCVCVYFVDIFRRETINIRLASSIHDKTKHIGVVVFCMR